MFRQIAPALAGAALCWGLAAPATAKIQERLAYPFDKVWNTAFRMVRVDLGHKVTEKDAEAGFLLFDYKDHGKVFQGSFQLVRAEGGARVISEFHVEGMPTYVERHMIDKLKRKLRAEYGEPPPPKRPKPAPEPAPEEPGEEPGAEDQKRP